ncbi:hypothetical protein EV426DRAFT_703708, partial [Tirmania nivea]
MGQYGRATEADKWHVDMVATEEGEEEVDMKVEVIVRDEPECRGINEVQSGHRWYERVVGDALAIGIKVLVVAGDASVGDASVGDASVGDASVGDASVGDASVGDASVGDASVGDAVEV